eukprot:scaffold23570_cov112-Isochrysis_galbana.AAC.5
MHACVHTHAVRALSPAHPFCWIPSHLVLMRSRRLRPCAPASVWLAATRQPARAGASPCPTGGSVGLAIGVVPTCLGSSLLKLTKDRAPRLPRPKESMQAAPQHRPSQPPASHPLPTPFPPLPQPPIRFQLHPVATPDAPLDAPATRASLPPAPHPAARLKPARPAAALPRQSRSSPRHFPHRS